MVRIGLSVEGTTEERFVKQVLYPHLINHDICVVPISMRGNISLERAAHELKKLANNFDYVSTFYDFYGFKRRPDEVKSGNDLAAGLALSVGEGVGARLIPYIQMYEFESLLFSCPKGMAVALQTPEAENWCRQILAQFDGNPELINDSPMTAPSKRLERETTYKKTIDGPKIAQEIGLTKIREKCQGFDQWLSSIEGLALASE